MSIIDLISGCSDLRAKTPKIKKQVLLHIFRYLFVIIISPESDGFSCETDVIMTLFRVVHIFRHFGNTDPKLSCDDDLHNGHALSD